MLCKLPNKLDKIFSSEQIEQYNRNKKKSTGGYIHNYICISLKLLYELAHLNDHINGLPSNILQLFIDKYNVYRYHIEMHGERSRLRSYRERR